VQENVPKIIEIGKGPWKSKRNPQLFGIGDPKDPQLKSGGNSDLILLALASDFLGARGRAFLVALIKQLSSFGF